VWKLWCGDRAEGGFEAAGPMECAMELHVGACVVTFVFVLVMFIVCKFIVCKFVDHASMVFPRFSVIVFHGESIESSSFPSRSLR
jgi:hypothetical protein